MVQIGEYLKQVRTTRGYSVASVEQATRIPSKYICAVEEDRFDYLPGRAYVIGIINSYANFLEVDSAEIIAAYKKMYPEENIDLEVPSKPMNLDRSFRGIIPVMLILLLLAGGFIYFYFGQDFLRPAENTLPEPTTVVIPEPDTTIPETVVPETTVPETVPEPTTVIISAPEPPIIDGLKLEINAVNGDCWLGYTVDAEEQQKELMLTRGNSMTINADEKIVIRFGSGGAVTVTLNGEEQPPLGRVGQIVNKIYNK